MRPFLFFRPCQTDGLANSTARIAKDAPAADGAKQPAAKLYDVGNVTLFLAGDMGEKIAGAVVARDGSYRNM